MLSLTITATESENTIQFNQAGWTHLDKYNLEEADVSLALHDTNSDLDCMIVSNDIVIFLFLVYVCYKRNAKQPQCMKYDSEKEQTSKHLW